VATPWPTPSLRTNRNPLIRAFGLDRFERGALVDEGRRLRPSLTRGYRSMLYIPCLYCGARDETEFTYGGPSHVARPGLTSTDRDWTHYLYHRLNTKGPYRERWLHSFGCGRLVQCAARYRHA